MPAYSLWNAYRNAILSLLSFHQPLVAHQNTPIKDITLSALREVIGNQIGCFFYTLCKRPKFIIATYWWFVVALNLFIYCCNIMKICGCIKVWRGAWDHTAHHKIIIVQLEKIKMWLQTMRCYLVQHCCIVAFFQSNACLPSYPYIEQCKYLQT